MRQYYVLGFLFDDIGENVVLIRKISPEWQRGLLNGVGGKIEEMESPKEAMIREFREETGLTVETWMEAGNMGDSEGELWEVFIFVARSDRMTEVTSITEEQVAVYPVSKVINMSSSEALGNVPWLVPACKDFLFNPVGPIGFDVLY